MKKKIPIVAGALLIMMLSACSAAQNVQQEYTDMMGRPVEAVENPQRIISLSASNTETLYALGLGDKIVGLDEYSNYPPDTAAVQKVGDFLNPNIEAIAALEPDIIFTSNKMQRDVIDSLQALSLNVAAIEATVYDEIDDSILLIGQLADAESEARKLVDDMKAEERRVLALDRPEEAVSCYYILSAGESGNWTSGPGSFINDMMALLGITAVTNIEGGVPWMDFNLEALVASDPDVLLMSADSGYTAEDLKVLNGYSDLTAVKEGRVHIIEPDLLNPGPRILEGLRAMYDAVYGG